MLQSRYFWTVVGSANAIADLNENDVNRHLAVPITEESDMNKKLISTISRECRTMSKSVEWNLHA